MSARARPVSRRAVLGGAAALVPAASMPDRSFGATPVDLAIVMLIDGSGSITDRMRGFQILGHSEALRSSAVANAMVGGPIGRVAVAVAGFSDPGPLTILVPWRIVDSQAGVANLADAIAARMDWVSRGSTAIGSALLGALELLNMGDFEATRRVIDLSCNGFSNSGPSPEIARPLLVEAGVVVNGLAILNEYSWLGRYYADMIITGPGAFVREVFDPGDYQAALTQKLIHEIA